MRILFVGDIVGGPGRRAFRDWGPKIRSKFSIDITVVNAENAAGGLGVTPELLDELLKDGADAFTLGNHTWRKKSLAPAIDRYGMVTRPANYPMGVPGQGATIIRLADGRVLGIVNLIGRVFMEAFDCPFAVGEATVARLRETTSTILVDMHAEATAEKVAMGWYLDGKCTAVVGTHTHIQTADERILPGGTAYITDVGMTGPTDSVIGMERELILRKFLTGMPEQFEVATGRPCLCGVVIESDDATGKAISITRVMEFGN